MERVAFLLEESNDQIRCLLNPESLTIQRLAGVRPRRSIGGELTGRGLSDDPLVFTGGGRMEIHLDLLFDVTLAGSSIATANVRDLTIPFWNLAENSSRLGYGQPPQVRFLWGKFWDVPGVVLAVSERLEQFTADGTARRSWLRMRLLRVNDSAAMARAGNTAPPPPKDFAALSLANVPERGVQVHAIVGGGQAAVEPGASSPSNIGAQPAAGVAQTEAGLISASGAEPQPGIDLATADADTIQATLQAAAGADTQPDTALPVDAAQLPDAPTAGAEGAVSMDSAAAGAELLPPSVPGGASMQAGELPGEPTADADAMPMGSPAAGQPADEPGGEIEPPPSAGAVLEGDAPLPPQDAAASPLHAASAGQAQPAETSPTPVLAQPGEQGTAAPTPVGEQFAEQPASTLPASERAPAEPQPPATETVRETASEHQPPSVADASQATPENAGAQAVETPAGQEPELRAGDPPAPEEGGIVQAAVSAQSAPEMPAAQVSEPHTDAPPAPDATFAPPTAGVTSQAAGQIGESTAPAGESPASGSSAAQAAVETIAPPMVFGERLDQIAYRYYGDPRYWRLLALFNGIDDPIHVPPGRLLRVPPIAAIKIL